MKYVIDPTVLFDGSVITSMADGVHCTYTGLTIEQLREKYNNPCLQIVGEESIRQLYLQYEERLHNGPVEEIDEEAYIYSYECLPPARNMRDMFFVGEPYYGNIFPFCFKAEGRYFRCRKNINTPREQLEKEIAEFMTSLRHSEYLLLLQECETQMSLKS